MAQLRDLVGQGLPDAVARLDRTALRLAATGSRWAPGPVAAIVRRRIRAETRGVVIPAADPAFARHVAARTDAGFDLNINLLGEAIRGVAQASPTAAVSTSNSPWQCGHVTSARVWPCSLMRR